jgi:hypothetical protein
MWRFFPMLAASFLLALAGCSDGINQLDGYQMAKGDLGDFILQSAPKFGVRLLTTNGLPAVPARWRHRATSDELVVIVDGNCYPQLDALLTKAVGPLQGQPRPNRNGSLEAYFGTNVGATVSCEWGIREAGREYTSFVIVGYGLPASDQAKREQLLREAVKNGNDAFTALDAARSSAPYVSEFLRLFPKAEVRYRSFTGGLGFDINVDLYERYEFTMQLPAVFDSSRSKVIDYGEPRFTLWEAATVKQNKSGIAETTLNPTGERRFGSVEWRKIVETGGDFGAIGYTLITNKPVQGFSDRKAAK